MTGELENIRYTVIAAMEMLDLHPDVVYKFELDHGGGGALTIFQRVPDPIARPLEDLEANGLLIPLHEMHVYAGETAEILASRIRAAVDEQTAPASNSEMRQTAGYRGVKDWWLATWRRHMPNTNDTARPPVTKIELTGNNASLGSTTNQAVYGRQHIDDLREIALKRGLIATGEVPERDQLIFLLMWHDAMLAERVEAVRRIQEDYLRRQDDLNADFKRQVEKANAEFAMRVERWKSDVRRKRAAGRE